MGSFGHFGISLGFIALQLLIENQVFIVIDVIDIINRVQSTVRLRIRKNISGHHFQTIGKLASNDFSYHTDVFNSI